MDELIRSLGDNEPGVIPFFFDNDLRDTLMGTQEESDFWYDFICKVIPKDHWIQPGMTARRPDVTYLSRRGKRARRK